LFLARLLFAVFAGVLFVFRFYGGFQQAALLDLAQVADVEDA
jgi:hypothetical protein